MTDATDDTIDRHLSPEEMERLLPGIPGEGPPEERRRHLEACGRCRRELDELEALHGALRSLPEPELPGGFARAVMARVRLPLPWHRRLWTELARRWPTVAAAAILVLAVAGGALWIFSAPGVTPQAVATFTLERLSDLLWSGVLAAARFLWRSGIPDLLTRLAGDVELLEAVVATGITTLVALGTATMLVRLMRVPAPYTNGARS